MSQWGARQAASTGAAEPAITSFYYPGTTRSSTAPNSSIDVLLTADTGSDVIVRAEPGLAVSYRAQSGQQTSLTLPSRIGSCTVGWWRAQATQSDIAIQALCGGSYTTWRSPSQVSAAAPVVFTPSDGMADVARRLSSGFERKAYRGSIEAHLVGSSLRAVNAVPLEEYLRGVVPNEMPSSWPQEALRAQAVAARTYAMREAQDRGGYFDVYDTTASQVYPGARLYDSSWRVVRSYEAATTDAAISATRGVYLRHDGRPAFTQFSSSNGGVTAAGTQPYLRRQADPWDRAATSNSRLNWTDSVSAASLEGTYPQIGRLERIRVLDREGLGDWGGRVLTMRLEGTRGSVTISGDSRVRSALGTNSSYLTLR
jgi:SpoIID/LytB domain protein